MTTKHIITLTVDVAEEDERKVRRLASSIEALIIEAMGLTGRRGFSVGMGIEKGDQR